MTISRAAFAAINKFVASLPEYVPATALEQSGTQVFLHWGEPDIGLYFTEDGKTMGFCLEATKERLIEHYRPKPRRFAVLVHTPHGLASLEAARGTSVFLDTPENRAYCAKEGETWLTFDLVERE